MISQSPAVLLLTSEKLASDLREILERYGLRVEVAEAVPDSSSPTTACDIVVVESSMASDRDISNVVAAYGESQILRISNEPLLDPADSKAAWGPWCDDSLMSVVFRLLLQTWRRREFRILDQLPMPAYLWRREGDDDRLIGFNERAVKVTEGGIRQFLGITAREHYEDLPDAVAALETCRRTGELVVDEYDYEDRSIDEIRPLRVHYVAIPPNDILVLTEDLTEIRQARKELEERTSRAQAIFESAGEGMALLDSTGLFEAVNPKGSEILGFAPGQLQNYRSTDLVDSAEEKVSVAGNLATLQPGESLQTRRAIRRPDGASILLDLNTAVRPDGGFVSFFRDVTAEEKHRADLLKKSAALDSSITGIAMAGLEGPMDYVNPAFVRMLGAESADEIVGKLPSDFARGAQEVIGVLAKDGVWSGELDLQRVDGSWIVAEVNASLVRDEHGEVQAILGSFLDVTERHRMNEEVRQSKDRLEEAERIAGVGNWFWDIPSGEIQWSDQVYRIFGVDRASYQSSYENFLNCVHPDDRPEVQRAVEEALQRRTAYRVEHRIGLPEGSVRIVEERGEILVSEDGEPIGMRGTVLDITDWKRTEERREKLQRLYSTLSSVTEAVAKAESTDDVLRQACRITVRESGLVAAGIVLSSQLHDEPILALAAGLDVGDEVGQGWLQKLREADLDNVVLEDDYRVCNDAESQKALGHSVADALLALGGRSMAVFRLRRGNDTAGLVCVAAPRKEFFGDEEVQLLRRLVDHLELALETRHREFQRQAAEKRQKELQESLRRSETLAAMGRLVSGVAHEVRNPLFGLSASLDAFAAEFGERREMETYLKIFRSQISRLSVLMNDLLDLGRPAGLSVRSLRVSELVERSIEQCSALLDPFDVRVENHLAEGGVLNADRDRFQQVLVNLLENAAQHSLEGGEIVLRVEARQDDEGRRGTLFQVLDQGPGFLDRDLDRVFEPFFSRRKNGNGLGLSIVERIVQDHGGRIRAANRRPDGDPEADPLGAMVEVWLPETQ